MLKSGLILFALIIIAGYFTNCLDKKADGRVVAVKYCSSCHLFPEPSLLDKLTWQKGVLPAMGKLLGAEHIEGSPFEESDRLTLHKKPGIPKEDWNKVIGYYLTEAPQSMPLQPRPIIQKISDQFFVQKKTVNTHPQTTLVKIDPGNKWIYVATRDSLLTVFDSNLSSISTNYVGDISADMFFTSPLIIPGSRKGLLTKMGMMDPNDLKTGSQDFFFIDDKGRLTCKKNIDSLPRPVQSISSDFDRDGRTDYLICGFGNKEGSFFWMQNKGNKGFEKIMLLPLPGAIKAYVKDFNNDGLTDIVALFAQANEGIYLFINKGNGKFETKEIIRFPPVYGSTFFELVDFNGDGKEDILYTCGDNADYSQIKKNYHGIYIFINEGNFVYTQKYFFPLHGAFKALAKDFDGDGDLDIAAISFFPDTKNQPLEGFVFLKQVNEMQFEPYSIPGAGEGRWLVMDVGDADGDGDQDIIIGSYLLQDGKASTPEEKLLFFLLKNKRFHP